MSEIKKKKHVSRRSKAAWRKHIDIKDVDDFLEEKRLEERIGTVAEKADKELFVVDTKAKSKKKTVALTPKQLKRQSARKPPRSFEPLINKSNVQDPIVKRNRVRTKEERKHFIAKSKAAQKLKEGIVPQRILQAHEQRLKDKLAKAKLKVERKPQFNKDLWEVEDNVVPDKFKVHWITPELVKYHMYNRGRPMMKTPQITHEKRSQLKAVVVPHPGVSYNPSVADHVMLLDKVVEKEKAIIKEEKHLDRVTTKLFTKMTPAEREALDRKELVQGFPIPENTDTESDDDSGEEYQAVNPPSRNKKKDRKTRNKEKTAREKSKLEKLAKREVRKIVDINRVPEFQGEIKKTDAKREASHNRAKAIRAAQKFEARRIGKMAYEEPEVDFVSGDQLAGNLRNLQPAGSILVDRFKSMQKRNILVPNAKRKAPKSRVKHTTKRSHRHEEDYGIGQVEGLASQIKKAKV